MAKNYRGLILLLILSAFVVTSCKGDSAVFTDAQPDLSARTPSQLQLENEIKTSLMLHSDAEILDMADIAQFDWDVLYIFGENTSYTAINKALGMQWLPNRSFYIEELTDLLVFVQGKQVVNHVVIEGDIFVATTVRGFERNEALFKVKDTQDVNRPKVLISLLIEQ
ncbi:MAG: hypothetical protein WAZ19_07880 [Anaerolineae bacterium]